MRNITQENVGKASAAVQTPLPTALRHRAPYSSSLPYPTKQTQPREDPARTVPPNTLSGSFWIPFSPRGLPCSGCAPPGRRDRHPRPVSDGSRRRRAANQRISPCLPSPRRPRRSPSPDCSNVAAPAPPPGRHRLPGAPRGFRAAAAGPRLPGTGRERRAATGTGGGGGRVCVGMCSRLLPRVSSVSLGAGAAIGPGEEADGLEAVRAGTQRRQRGGRKAACPQLKGSNHGVLMM